MAPEQLAGREHSPAADVYSLALSLWVAAGASTQRLGATPSERVRHRLGDDLPPLAGVADPRLAAAVSAGGLRELAARSSAKELARMLTAG